MSTNQILGIVLLVTGAVLVYLGYQASQSLGEQVHETFTGRFTDSTTWYFVFGVVAAVAGLLVMRR
jgi:drug/metabolite transporter (DMT)-like permease